MNSSVIIFYILSAVILGGALFAVLTTKIFRAAVYLLFSLIGVAGLYFYLKWEFLAAVQIVVYVGGIIVLIIFSIFLTHGSGHKMKKPALARVLISSLLTALLCSFTPIFIKQYSFISTPEITIEPSVRNIGRQMLSLTEYGYILPFEVVGILLLAAMIGCIVIAFKIKPQE